MRRNVSESRMSRFLLVLVSFIIAASTQATAMGLSFGGGGTSPSVPLLNITPGPMASPFRVTIDPGDRERLLVTDHSQRAVLSVDPENPDNVQTLFTITGRPLGIARAGGQLVFVGNEQSGTVEVYNLHGRLLRSFRVNTPMIPSDLALDMGEERLFVVDSAAGNIKVFNLGGRLLQTISGDGDLLHPMGIAVDPQTRRLVVTDFGDPAARHAASVQLFNYDGGRLLKITGTFSSPRGADIDGNRLFVVDALLGQVLVFNATTGARSGAIGSFGTGPGQLLLPLDVTWDASRQTLFVTNNRVGRVTPLAAGF